MKLRKFWICLLMVAMMICTMACGDDGDDDDDKKHAAGWTTVIDDDGVIRVDVPTSWTDVHSECNKDNDGQPLLCVLYVAPDIEDFRYEWDESASEGVAIIIGDATYLMQENVLDNTGMLRLNRQVLDYVNNCDLKDQKPFVKDDGMEIFTETYHHCGQSDAKITSRVGLTGNKDLRMGFIVKGISMKKDEATKIAKSTRWNWN